MKDWLARQYPGDEEVPYETLRQRIINAWDAKDGSNLFQLAVDSMPQRCQDVIDANGGHTKW